MSTAHTRKCANSPYWRFWCTSTVHVK